MRLADVTPYARRRLTPDDRAEIADATPRHLHVNAFTDPSGVFVTVKVMDGHAVRGTGTAKSTIEAFRKAYALLDVELPPVVSLFTGPAR